ncbi:MAG: M23 family metallopeptidase, partial [Bdellovibrionales bacterium]
MNRWRRFFIVIAPLSALIIASSHQQATSQVAAQKNASHLPTAPTNTSKRFYPFKKAETLSGLLKRHGFNDKQIVTINRQNLLPKGLSLSNGEKYRVRQSADKRFTEIKIYEAPRNLAYLFWRHKNNVGALLREEDFRVKEKNVKGQIHGSLLTSISKAVPFAWTAYRFMDAFTFDHNLPKQLQRGARFQFRVETKYDGSDLIGYGEILEASLEIGKSVEKRFFVRYPGGGTFLDPENSLSTRPLYAPVSYLRISSLFNGRRFHPIKNRRQPHMGVDFELPEGTDVFAAEAGMVIRSGFQRAAGNFVVVRHASGLESYYNHLSNIATNVFPGARVANGQKVGEIGCTGYCTKAHLHFA